MKEVKHKKPQVSVVIPSYNSQQHIEKCLMSVLGQKTEYTFEVIVVDSSTDATPTIITAQFPTVKLIHLNEQTYPGAGRNIGVQHAQGDIIAFIDSDCVADENWLEKGVGGLQQGYSIVGGSVKNGNPGFISWPDYFLTFNEFMPSMPRREAPFMPTCNFFITKDAFKKIGGFREDLLAGEDTLFCYAAAREYRLSFEPALQVSHSNRETWKNFIQHHRNFGRHSAYVRKHANIVGKNLVRNPSLVLLAPAARIVRISWRMIYYNWRFLPVFILSLPLMFTGTITWSYGFMKEAWKK